MIADWRPEDKKMNLLRVLAVLVFFVAPAMSIICGPTHDMPGLLSLDSSLLGSNSAMPGETPQNCCSDEIQSSLVCTHARYFEMLQQGQNNPIPPNLLLLLPLLFVVVAAFFRPKSFKLDYLLQKKIPLFSLQTLFSQKTLLLN